MNFTQAHNDYLDPDRAYNYDNSDELCCDFTEDDYKELFDTVISLNNDILGISDTIERLLNQEKKLREKQEELLKIVEGLKDKLYTNGGKKNE